MKQALQSVATEQACLFAKTLVLYSVAEAQAGHATKITARLDGNQFSVSDNGRGHSVDRMLGETPYLDYIYGQLEVPVSSAGIADVQLQGLGTSLLSANSECLEVVTARNGLRTKASFRHGSRHAQEVEHCEPSERGNTITGVAASAGASSEANLEDLASWLGALSRSFPAVQFLLNGASIEASPK